MSDTTTKGSRLSALDEVSRQWSCKEGKTMGRCECVKEFSKCTKEKLSISDITPITLTERKIN